MTDGMDFLKAMSIAKSGLRAQAGRIRVHVGKPRQRRFDGADAGRRSLPAQGADLFVPSSTVRSTPASSRSARIKPDMSAFRIKYEPGNPAADATGNVKYPNVNPIVEMTDMREAQRSYEANLNVISATRRMIQQTLNILKS